MKGGVKRMPFPTPNQAVLHFPTRLSDLLRQPHTFQALLLVEDCQILDDLEERTGINLRYSAFSAPDGNFQGRIDKTIQYMREQMQWNASQIVDYLAQAYNM